MQAVATPLNALPLPRLPATATRSKSSLLEATLLEKDAQLEAVQARLQVRTHKALPPRTAAWRRRLSLW